MKRDQPRTCPSNSPVQAPPEDAAPLRDWFRKFAYRAASAVGSPLAFFVSCTLLLVWAATGPAFHFSDTWQLIINTGTTIVTFLMVFLIQNSQNRDAKAIHLKLDELIRSIKGARNGLVSLETCTEEELAELEQEFARLRHVSRQPKADGRANPQNSSDVDVSNG